MPMLRADIDGTDGSADALEEMKLRQGQGTLALVQCDGNG